ncbi:GGDEF domain-containing phosphodiesterase [Roseibacterium sp. SDUM158017]|uniref:GGDEF domain-containing phosphodiesterase n=1 Tax=Roseicyclus salinarum TaxID=3036773 RepID=UPI002414F391|nr:GGDEF domain-containing phosphodiesterase [Roseibacterium sp. SDUM158017]MDG4650222.1 GGDEF domain-containing phosphodiesterase [Roseibacterium sp. SDUM158017]
MLFPILVLVSQEIGGPDAVLMSALVLPALLVLLNLGGAVEGALADEAGTDGRPGREAMAGMLRQVWAMDEMDTACLVLAIDDWTELSERLGREGAEDVHRRCAARLRATLRHDDLLADLGQGRFGIVLHPIPAARLGIRDELCDRLRAAIAEPIAIGGAAIRITASAGHAALRFTGRDAAASGLSPAAATVAGAEAALKEARTAGPNSVRAHVPGRDPDRTDGTPLAEEVAEALVTGAIRPWFQPQVDARNGALTGFEALARWQHPTLGLLGPSSFLGAVAEAGRLDALGRTMREGALDALRHWDRAGAVGITVSVNAAPEELRGTNYAEQVAWELDRHDVAPERLVVEVLETVAATARDDSIVTTLAALREKGVGIDLDDFGVGQASLMSIRRFGVERIKIDRSFVIGIDIDEGQKAMVAAIVSMAREMGLVTLAEGVETPQEAETLGAMGCGYLQGFAIGKPMPLAETLSWLAKRAAPPLRHEGPAPLLRPAE